MKGLMIRIKTRECGTLKFDPICDLCKKKGNYPMAGWNIEGDDEIWIEQETWICLDCIEKVGFEVHHYEEGDTDGKDNDM